MQGGGHAFSWYQAPYEDVEVIQLEVHAMEEALEQIVDIAVWKLQNPSACHTYLNTLIENWCL